MFYFGGCTDFTLTAERLSSLSPPAADCYICKSKFMIGAVLIMQDISDVKVCACINVCVCGCLEECWGAGWDRAVNRCMMGRGGAQGGAPVV